MIWAISAFLLAAALTVVLWLRRFTAPQRKVPRDVGPMETWSVSTGQGRAPRHAYLVRGVSAARELAPRPVVLGFHGGTGSPINFLHNCQMAPHSDAAKMALCLPAAQDRWADGRAETGAAWSDDEAFFENLIRRMERDTTLDARHLFAFGISNGAMFTMRLACEFGDRLTAAACLMGAMPRDLWRELQPGPPVPMLLIAGRKDPMVPFQGGRMPDIGGHAAGGEILSARETENFWAKRNRCLPKPRTYRTRIGANRAEVREYRAGPDGADLVAVTLPDAKHNWPARGQTPANSAEAMVTQFFQLQLEKIRRPRTDPTH